MIEEANRLPGLARQLGESTVPVLGGGYDLWLGPSPLPDCLAQVRAEQRPIGCSLWLVLFDLDEWRSSLVLGRVANGRGWTEPIML